MRQVPHLLIAFVATLAAIVTMALATTDPTPEALWGLVLALGGALGGATIPTTDKTPKD